MRTWMAVLSACLMAMVPVAVGTYRFLGESPSAAVRGPSTPAAVPAREPEGRVTVGGVAPDRGGSGLMEPVATARPPLAVPPPARWHDPAPSRAPARGPSDTRASVPSAAELRAELRELDRPPHPVAAVRLPAGTRTYIVLGKDSSGRGYRTDTIILVYLHPGGEVRMLSLPRDLWVWVPGKGGHVRLNTVDSLGGPDLLRATLRHNLGLHFEHFVRVDFQAFVQAIDAVGGIDLLVPCPLGDGFPDPAAEGGVRQFSVPAGEVHMDGQTALFYVRSRLSTNDFDRSRRQQEVLLALRARLLRLDVLPRLPSLWRSLVGGVQTDVGFEDALVLARQALSYDPSRTSRMVVGAGLTRGRVTDEGWQVLVPRPGELRRALGQFLSGQTAPGVREPRPVCPPEAHSP